MFLHDEVIAIIPARAGSKGLPGKNLMTIAGKSLVEHAIFAAQECMFIDHIVVSSDDERVLAIAHSQDAINHRRSEAAATDSSTAADVIRDYFENTDVMIDPAFDPWIVYLQPTSPARTADMIEEAFTRIDAAPGARALVSLVAPSKSPYWSVVLDHDKKISPLFPEAYSNNRQSLADAYLPNGAIYIFKLSEFRKQERVPFVGAIPYVMTAEDSIDIDTQEDFDRAKAMLEK